jgi:hypothetical protein
VKGATHYRSGSDLEKKKIMGQGILYEMMVQVVKLDDNMLISHVVTRLFLNSLHSKLPENEYGSPSQQSTTSLERQSLGVLIELLKIAFYIFSP